MTRSTKPAHEPMPEDFGFQAQSGQQNAEYGQYLNRLGQCIVSGITGLPLKYVRPLWLPRPGRQPALTTNWCGVGYGLVADANLLALKRMGFAYRDSSPSL